MGLNSLHPHRDGLPGIALEPLALWLTAQMVNGIFEGLTQ